jgi:HAD domain in Swiss Army Knife RNA repair proteins
MSLAYLFLDIDGVLNNHDFDKDAQSNGIHKEKAEMLNVILKRTDAKIVLISAWRYLVHRGDMTLSGLEYLLCSHGIMKGRLIGITRMDTMIDGKPVPNERGKQIHDWLLDNVPDGTPYKYVVMDDLDLGISEACHPFVQTEDAIGMRPDDAYRAIQILLGEI